jgi:GcrA cell cycle regulator|tara:strand:+ start:10 stop:519 length:510 start_codon:yes stop_codon:yes gene_type:complete
MAWDSQRVERLRIYWSKGYTASEIAKMLGEGVTRNSVIGKAHRLKLASRALSKQSKSPKKQNTTNNLNKQEGRISKKSRFKSLLLDKNFPPENPKKLEELDDKNCRWPNQHHPNEEGFYFCGRPSVKGFSYCKLHVLFAFQIRDQKEELTDKENHDVPAFLEKKIKTAK